MVTETKCFVWCQARDIQKSRQEARIQRKRDVEARMRSSVETRSPSFASFCCWCPAWQARRQCCTLDTPRYTSIHRTPYTALPATHTALHAPPYTALPTTHTPQLTFLFTWTGYRDSSINLCFLCLLQEFTTPDRLVHLPFWCALTYLYPSLDALLTCLTRPLSLSWCVSLGRKHRKHHQGQGHE